ncbi:D-alanyl-D-alanine carboxypeptidase [Paraliobacillus sp. PM-2]|uniref:M15 family metallopeptidase n=1 Tax=Paraliobacillus sp. PM-2 TaxID=1462524 RepID=UPI00061BEA57|nr:M15 family metallopeptidase [Paraliobacillus sp. PM-2]CQR47062.1 D-alanyl-D-alanine carboxypeptidase [Paraliobacillus sp. PM-2]
MRKYVIIIIFFVGMFLTACQQENTQETQNTNENDQQEQNENTDQSNENENSEQTSDESKNGKKDETNQNEDNNENDQTEEINKHIAKVEKNTGLHVVDNPESIKVYVNKQRKLPVGYTPPHLTVPDVPHYSAEGHPKRQLQKVAADALEKLFAEAKNQGIGLVAVSGYRSYERQEQIYQNNVATNGKEHADKYSAKPGTSEHQTGLAMDVASATETTATLLEQSFSRTDAGSWLAEHAHDFGFIIRYPEGKSNITGYNYEPWHVRYVGKDVAMTIYQKKITLEEYFGYDY